MKKETKIRSLVKTIIWRIYIVFAIVCLLVLTGEPWQKAFAGSLIYNIVMTVAFYVYDRIWSKIEWGKK
jgi:uncharacterized membrane protein